MGTKYTTTTISGYNSSPPADDGTASEANKVKWSTTKDKLADPIKDQVANIDAKLVSMADVGPDAKTSAYTTVAGDHQKTLEVTNATTITLLAVASAPAGYTVTIKNAGTNDVTVTGTGSEQIDGSTLDIYLAPKEVAVVQLNQAQTGYISLLPDAGIDIDAKTTNYTTVAGDHKSTLECSNTITITLLAAASAPVGYIVTVKNAGSGTITVTPTDLIDGSPSSITLAATESQIFQVNEAQTGYITLQQTVPVTASNENLYTESLVKVIHPDQSKGLQDLQRQGIYPVSFNQQWGGMGYGGLPDGTMGEIATGAINSDGNFANVASAVSSTYIAQGFKVSQSSDLSSVWVPIYKIGNPTNNLQLFIYDDSAGSPNAVITNGTATAQSGKLHTNSTDGELVKFTFPTSPSLTANTQYHIVLKSSGAVDASNYWRWISNQNGLYPHGSLSVGDATPAWTPSGTVMLFLIEPVTTILTSGLSGFDGAIGCYEGAPLDQSGAFYSDNRYMNHKRGMIHYAGTGFTKDKTFHDSGLAADNNRIVIRTNVATGYAQVDLYENDGTKNTVTGTADISTGNHIVSVGYRAEGDGSDYLCLYIDGVSEGTPLTSQTFTLDRAFEDGHITYGGGFPVAPTWTQDLDMSVLPSADGWTWTGTATESSAMVVSGGILYQNGAGYGSTDAGYYAKTTTLNNATGWVIETKIKVTEDSNNPAQSGARIDIYDGAKRVNINFHEYFIHTENLSSNSYIQHDLTKETNVLIIGKGSDFYIYLDGRLALDGTGLMTTATASNQIFFGDQDGTAGINPSIQWHYVKYYEGAYLPEYTDAQISEYAYWADDKSSLLSTIYNAGTIQSVKTLAGMNENYVERVKQVISVRGITSSPSTTSTSFVPLEDMSGFIFGGMINCLMQGSYRNSTGIQDTHTIIDVDGVSSGESYATSSSANYNVDLTNDVGKQEYASLHYISGGIRVSAGTGFANLTTRELIMESE